jgi:hypothetical protein
MRSKALVLQCHPCRPFADRRRVLEPVPEQADTITTFGMSGCRSIQNWKSGVAVYRQVADFTHRSESPGRYGATRLRCIPRFSSSLTSRSTASGVVVRVYCSVATFTPPLAPSIAGNP